MGVESKASVVGPNGQAHDHPNLYITDASIFAGSGGGESPSLTIAALALRAVDAAIG